MVQRTVRMPAVRSGKRGEGGSESMVHDGERESEGSEGGEEEWGSRAWCGLTFQCALG